MSKYSKFVEFLTPTFLKTRTCMITASTGKHLDDTTMFTYFHANTPPSQSEGAYYL